MRLQQNNDMTSGRSSSSPDSNGWFVLFVKERAIDFEPRSSLLEEDGHMISCACMCVCVFAQLALFVLLLEDEVLSRSCSETRSALKRTQ